MKVPLADLVAQYQALKPEIDRAVDEVLSTGRFILGPEVKSLEEEIAAHCGAQNAVGVNSGTDALLLSLLAQGVGHGDEVITSPFTFVATAEVVAQLGATPIFADIEPSTFNLCPTSVEERITERTKAIVPIDLFGQMSDRTAFIELAEKHNLALVWDAAQAIGSKWHGQSLGDFPGCATLSFFPTKNLGACGDGGMVLTNDIEVRDRILQYRVHGSSDQYYYKRVGYCSRLDALQAAILRVKLRHLNDWTEARRRNADRYRELLAGTCAVLPVAEAHNYHIYHQFTIRHPRRDELKAFLKERGIDTGIYYPLALHLQEAYQYLGYQPGDLPHSERATKEVLSLPVHPELSAEQLEYVASSIQEFDTK